MIRNESWAAAVYVGQRKCRARRRDQRTCQWPASSLSILSTVGGGCTRSWTPPWVSRVKEHITGVWAVRHWERWFMGIEKMSLSYDTAKKLIMHPFYFSVSDARAVTALVFVCLWGTGFAFHSTRSVFFLFIILNESMEGEGKKTKTELCLGRKSIICHSSEKQNKAKKNEIYKDCKTRHTLSFSEHRRINQTETPCTWGCCLCFRVGKNTVMHK